MGFGVLSNLPNYYIKQKVLKELFNRFDIYDNTIHAVAGEVEITTKKIVDALGTPFPDKVVPKELGDEDFAFGKNSREPIAQPPWIHYWNGRTFWDRMKQEKRDVAVRMFEKHGQSWMDIEKNRPHDIASLVNHQEYMVYLDKNKLLTHRFLFAPILFSEHWWLYVQDVEKRDFFVLDSKNIVSPSDERSTMNRFASNILDQMRIWAGAPSIFNEGSCSLLPRYVNIPRQPNETDCGVFVMKWMELIDPTGLAACCEANKGYNIEKWGEPQAYHKHDGPSKSTPNILMGIRNELLTYISYHHNSSFLAPMLVHRSCS
ncbi:hypothetical protein PIB30_041558 [Stylosanthes scabra]|uniref:Ubiquitin-like protease family profile domain-containing protein n=1 Tax=Stylosanthes scabra TaxID=79078 RepID=A0ABU6ZDS0_9FABA|nr:hypothetical protein [Stylosanthes scabra]